MYFLLILYLLFWPLVIAIPTWEDSRQTTISSLVGPSASYIEAVNAFRSSGEYRTKHLSLSHPGQPSNLTILPKSQLPSLFYIYHNQLWQFNNETSIYPVDILQNSTDLPSFPLQLVASKKQTGLKNGIWRWRGTMLYYDHGGAGNSGLYYSCPVNDGASVSSCSFDQQNHLRGAKRSPCTPGAGRVPILINHSWT